MWSAREIEGLRRLLMEHWDPIGVYHVSDDDEDREAYWDEYDSYIPAILSDLERGGDSEWLTQYLARRRTIDMGLGARPDVDRRAAQAIVNWNRQRAG